MLHLGMEGEWIRVDKSRHILGSILTVFVLLVINSLSVPFQTRLHLGAVKIGDFSLKLLIFKLY